MPTQTLRVPASSANLGPGFDALGIALTSYLDFTFHCTNEAANRDLLAHELLAHDLLAHDLLAHDLLAHDQQHDLLCDEHHLAVRTFREHGGVGAVHIAAQFPGGRGLGFSAAARAAGIAAAALQRGEEFTAAKAGALGRTRELEHHGDNAAACVLGGIVAVSGSNTVAVPLGCQASVVVWIPKTETSTKKSRAALPTMIAFDDAVFNVGQTAVLIAALASGNTAALREACDDRFHQPVRWPMVPESFRAYEAMLDAGVWCAWLSGSGPSVAALCAPRQAERIGAQLPTPGRSLICSIDTEGMRLL